MTAVPQEDVLGGLLAEARAWQALAISLHDENCELRLALLSVVAWVATAEELLGLGRELIDKRFPEGS